MYELLITEFAEQDLDGIVEYIAVKLANPPAAGDVLGQRRRLLWKSQALTSDV